MIKAQDWLCERGVCLEHVDEAMKAKPKKSLVEQEARSSLLGLLGENLYISYFIISIFFPSPDICHSLSYHNSQFLLFSSFLQSFGQISIIGIFIQTARNSWRNISTL